MHRVLSKRLPVALAVMALGSGALHATNKLTLSSTAINLSCSTQTGPGAAVNITVKPVTALTGTSTLAVTLPGSFTGGLVVTPPSTTTLSTANQTAGIVYSVSLAAGCVGVTNAATPSFQFTAGGTADASVTATTTLTSSVSGLSVSSSLVTLNCVLSGSTYTAGSNQNVSLTSTATGGTPYTVVTSGLPTGVSVTPTSAGTAGTSPVTLVFSVSACGTGALGSSTSGSLVLHDSPGPDKTISVTLQIDGPTPLTATPNPASLTYVKGSGTPSAVNVTVSSSASPAPFFTVDTTTLPIWLTVDSVSGAVPKTLRFSSTTVCDSLAPGTYSANVHIRVATYGDLVVPFSMLITNPAPKLTVSGGTTQSLSWTIGQVIPTGYLTLISSDSPVPYSLTTGGPLAPTISAGLSSGLAYSFGTQIPVTFSTAIFAAAQPASVLTGTVTVTWGNPASTTVVTFNITVLSPQATLASISPASLPTASSGQSFTVVLNGSGFVPSTDPTQKTKVGIVSSGVLVQDTNIASTVVNASNMILTITVPATADTYLPFSGSGGTVVLGICNPQGTTCSVPTGTLSLSIGNGPIIQVVTSASSFQQVGPGQTQNIAPYDMLSIFGSNFCASSTPACSSSQILQGIVDPVTLVYQPYVTMDAAGSTQRKLTVSFCPTGTTTGCTNAPLLFATNSQINLVVPGSISTGTIDILVHYGYGTGSTMLNSTPVTVNVIATDPGIFAIGADGQGSGAILASDYSVIGASNPAGMRSTAADSDVVQIYMTGLGVPDSSATNSGTAGSSTPPTDCISPSAFLGTLNTDTNSSLGAVDGAILQSALLYTGKLPPCLTTLPTVSFGGQPATSVSYAGWVADSIAGLYQINATLPGTGVGSFTDSAGATHTSVTGPLQLPVTVTAGGHTSQTGVSIWIAPRLKVVAPTALTGQVGVAWASSGNLVVASEGTSPYRYAVTSGVLPTGLTLGQSTGAISGTPAANRAGSYVITVTATDSANVPLTGTRTFTLVVAGGLVLISNPASYTGTVVSSNTTATTVTATGGAYPYTYTFDSGFTPPTGMTIGSSTGAIGITSQTPGGVYSVVVDATDSNGLTGSITLTVTLNLVVTSTSGTSGLTGTSPTYSASASGGPYTINLASTGGTSYTYTFTTTPPSGFSISGSALTVSNSTAAGYTIGITSTDTGGATGTISLSITLH
jgi:uncharacterized protein (TIGR03437 family)